MRFRVITEIGGTFVISNRTFLLKLHPAGQEGGRNDVLYIHVTLIPKHLRRRTEDETHPAQRNEP